MAAKILPSRSTNFHENLCPFEMREFRRFLFYLVIVSLCACAPVAEKQKSFSKNEQAIKKAMATLYNPEIIDKKYALIEFEKACQLGNSYGCHMVGTAFNNGVYGKSKDYQQAKRWYMKAATKGYIPSQLNIANIYAHRLLPLNDEEGYYWLVLANESIQSCAPGSIETEPQITEKDRQRECRLTRGFYRKLLGIYRKRMSGENILRVENRVKEKQVK